MEIARREFLKIGSLGIVGVAGCMGVGGGDDEPDEVDDEPDEVVTPTPEPECTDVSISETEWEGNWLSDDDFHATLVNEGDVAGTVVVELRFWRSEEQESLEGSVQRSVSIGSQDTREITIEANRPTDDTEWGSMRVLEQDCQR